MIRKAVSHDVSRIAEILVFVKKSNQALKTETKKA